MSTANTGLSPFNQAIVDTVYCTPNVVHQAHFAGGAVGSANTIVNVTVPAGFGLFEVVSEQPLWINAQAGANSAGMNVSGNGVVTTNASFLSLGSSGVLAVAPLTVVSLYSANAQNASISFFNPVVR